MKNPTLLLLCLPALLSGCAGVGVQRPDAGAAAAPLTLSLGVLPFKTRSSSCPDVAGIRDRAIGDMESSGLFESVSGVASKRDAPDVDVLVTVEVNMSGMMAPTVTASSRSGKPLFTGKAMSGWNSLCGIDGHNIAAALSSALARGTPAFQTASAEREQRMGEKPLAAPGLTKADLAEAVKAAVSGQGAASAVTSDADQPKYTQPADANKFAVIVGVEKYTALPEARFAERDAQAMRAHAVALGFPERNVVLLTGAQATRTGLVKNLETWLARNVPEGATVLFYFSGHGAPDPVTGQAYLVPVDGDPAYLEDTGYPVKRLYEKLDGLKAKRVLVALDSCFSGAGGRSVLAKGTRPLVGKIDTGAVTGTKLVALTASKSSQISGTLEEQGHGVFTYYLLRGLNGAAKDSAGGVTAASLFEYLRPNVEDASRRANREQTPELLSSVEAAGVRLR